MFTIKTNKTKTWDFNYPFRHFIKLKRTPVIEDPIIPEEPINNQIKYKFNIKLKR